MRSRKRSARRLEPLIAVLCVMVTGWAIAQDDRSRVPNASELLARCIAKIKDASRRLDALTSQTPVLPPPQCSSNAFRLIVEKVVRERLEPTFTRRGPSSLDCEVAPRWRLEPDARLVVEGDVSDRDAVVTLLRDIARALPGIELDDTKLTKLDACLMRVTGIWYVLVPPERNSHLLRGSVRSEYQKYINDMPAEADCTEVGSEMEKTDREDRRDAFWVRRALSADGPVDVIACKRVDKWQPDHREDRARIIVRKTAP